MRQFSRRIRLPICTPRRRQKHCPTFVNPPSSLYCSSESRQLNTISLYWHSLQMFGNGYTQETYKLTKTTMRATAHRARSNMTIRNLTSSSNASLQLRSSAHVVGRSSRSVDCRSNDHSDTRLCFRKPKSSNKSGTKLSD